MEKFVPYEKMSKRKQRVFNQKQRRDWGLTNPATRKEKNVKAYDRKKLRSMDRKGQWDEAFLFFV